MEAIQECYASDSSGQESGTSFSGFTRLWPVPSEVVGFESYESELENWLLDNEFKNKVIYLVGMGGVGKTTLAELVYNKPVVSGNFNRRAWIRVSRSFSTRNLLRKLKKQFHQAKRTGGSAGEGDINFSQTLEEERYMVVFDDVWDASSLEGIKNALPESKRGCAVVITTRVSKILDVSWPPSFFVRVLELQPLPAEVAMTLFHKNVFLELWQGAYERIVQRCGGLPLAIVVAGEVLSDMEKSLTADGNEVNRFLANFHSMLNSNPLLMEMTDILLPQCSYLPPWIEACFLYFGIYPKDYSISCARLIRQWVAEGLVESEEIGDHCLTELVSLSLVQVSHTVLVNGKPRRCRVHNLMHDIIHSLSTKTADFHRDVETNYNYPWLVKKLEGENFSDLHIRPRFPLRVDDEPMPFRSTKWFANYKLLKMLDFEGTRDLICVPEEVGGLVFLTYLSVRNTKVMKLPKSIGQLQKLQTLDLKYSLVCELPLEISRLRKLRHVLAYYHSKRRDHHRPNDVQGVKINEWFGHSKGLQKLYHVDANNDVGLIKELRKFSQLRKLGITKLTRETSRALRTSFETMCQLENLQLFSAAADEILDLQSLEFPSLLQCLSVEGRLDKLPNFISHLHTLVRLTLRFSKLTDDPLEEIQYLVSLIQLELYEAYDGQRLHFKNGGFQNIKVLTLRGLPRLTSLLIGKWTLPFLEEFAIGEAPKLKEVPSGIQHLRALKTLEFYDMPDDFGLSMVPNGGHHYNVVRHIPDVRFYYKRDGGKRFGMYPLR